MKWENTNASKPVLSNETGLRLPSCRLAMIPSLDGVRAVAILLVLIAHIPFRNLQPPIFQLICKPLAMIPMAGYLGVDLFFVLSGFLITRILLHDQVCQRPLKYFFYRRFLRIFPIYYLVILFLLVIDPTWRLIPVALYLESYRGVLYPLWPWIDMQASHPLSHTWSLAVEEHFYLVWPFLVHFVSAATLKRAILFVAIPLMVLASALLVARWPDWAIGFIYDASCIRSMSLLAGAMLAFHEKTIVQHLRPKMWLLVAGLAVFGLGLVALVMGTLPKPWWRLSALVGSTCLCTSAVMSLLLLDSQSSQHGLCRALAWSPLRFIGRISYGLYLYHHVVFHYLKIRQGFEPGVSMPAWKVGLALLLSFAVATVSFYVIEQPLLKIKDRLR